jgi:hypothetical protein
VTAVIVAAGPVAKAEEDPRLDPARAGTHSHKLDRANATTQRDGAHRHVYVLPDGGELWTELDGEHEHPLSDETADYVSVSGAHGHRVVLPDGTALLTSEDGEHAHDLDGDSTALDGEHAHALTLPDGARLDSFGWSASDEVAIEKREPTEVQSLIFDKAKYTREQVVAWVESHGFEHTKLDETEQSYRVRQREPGDFELGGFRTIDLRTGIAAVIGQLRASRLAKSRGRSSSYLEAVLAAAKAHLPDWLWKQLHAAALPSAGGRARWRVDGPSALERMSLAQIEGRVGDMTDDDLLSVWSRLHQLYADAKRRKESDSGFVAAATAVRAELQRRGRKIGKTKLAALANSETPKIALQRSASDAAPGTLRPLRCFDDEKRLLYAVAMEPDVDDSHGERTTRDEIEAGAHAFLRSGVVGLEHAEKADAEIVESWIAPVDLEINGEKVRAGSWVVVIKVHDAALWEAVKRGDIGGVSVGGWAARRSA